jgi:glycosyltransferase involved in cell wall biosynthesis
MAAMSVTPHESEASGRSMRIAHIIYRYLPILGGAELYLDQLRRVIADLGMEQAVFQATEAGGAAGVIHVPPLALTPWKLVNFNLGLCRRRRALAAYDLLIVHNPEHLMACLPRPCLLVSHGATWTHERGAARRLRKRAMATAFKRARAVLANDSFVLREMGIAAEPGLGFGQELAPGVWFVPNAVDAARFCPDPAGAGEQEGLRWELGLGDAPFVLVPRNLTRSRGVDLAIAAFAASAALPPEALLAITGASIPDMPESLAYARELREQARALGVGERVRFLGAMAPARMPALYRAAALTLIPTRYSEGTSLAALESMACAAATISTAVEGLLDLPQPHPAPDADAIAAAIDQAWPDRSALGQAQRRAVLRDFDLPAWERSWRRILTSLSATGGQAPPVAGPDTR